MEKIKTGEADSIKRMKLYRYPERVYNEISAAGYGKDALLKEKDIRLFDQYHYLGTDVVEDAINFLEAGPQSRLPCDCRRAPAGFKPDRLFFDKTLWLIRTRGALLRGYPGIPGRWR